MSDGLSRRSFLKLAATAGAAAAIPGCEPAARKIIPYVVPDENNIPGVPTYYATTCSECSAGCGIIAKVREGRVIKLEGNPADPISQGAICARGQAALQGLYNPDRLDQPHMRGGGGLHAISWEKASSAFNDNLRRRPKSASDRIALITHFSRGRRSTALTKAWLQAWGSTRIVFWERIGEEPARAAADACFGRRDLPVYKLDQAETIISFGADFLETWGSPVEQARQYADFRAPKMRKGGLTIGKSAYVGPRLGTTGAKCDEWVAANPGTEGAVAMAVLNLVANQGWAKRDSGIDIGAVKNFAAAHEPQPVSQQSGVPVETINKLAEWFGQADGAVALAGGDDPQTYIAAYVLNAITGNVGRTMVFLDNAPPEPHSRPDDVRAVIQAIRDGLVDVVVVAGGANPAYSMPPSWDAQAAIRRAPFVVWLGDSPDDTADSAQLLMPTHHALESWRDSAPRAGVMGLGQPVMEPVVASRALHDILIASAHLGTGAAGQSIKAENAADAINAAWQDLQGKLAARQQRQRFLEPGAAGRRCFPGRQTAGGKLQLGGARAEAATEGGGDRSADAGRISAYLPL